MHLFAQCLRISDEAAVGFLDIEDVLQVFLFDRSPRGKHHDMGGVDDLVAVEGIGPRGRPGHALLALGRSGQNEMPRLGVGARRAEAEQVANGLHVAFRYPLVGIVELGGVAGLGSVDDRIAGPHERGEGGHDMGS